jgi:alcohol dehydrogenase class IV
VILMSGQPSSPDSLDLTNAPNGTFAGIPIDAVHFGQGAIGRLGQVTAAYGIERALIVTSRSIAQRPNLIGPLLDQLGSRQAGLFAETEAHVPRATVLSAARIARDVDADGIISFGGSTAHDTAKGVALALAEGVRDVGGFDPYAIRFDYPNGRVVPRLAGTTIPHLAVSTTLSAGEFTDIAGITNEATGEKDLYQDRRLACRAIFLDPDVTCATPEWLWLSSGVKAIDHCLEAYLSVSAQPMTDALALHAFRTLFYGLRKTKCDPVDRAARGNCQVAAWMSVAGLANVSLGLSHGIGHQLGGIAHVPHGYTSCITLPHVLVSIGR